VKLDEHLPVDHKLGRVYRFGAAFLGTFLLAFGILGFVRAPAFYGRRGDIVLGLSSNGLLDLVSVVVGALLVVAAFVGGNFASTVNAAVGVLFVVSGLLNLALLRTPLNIFAFQVRNAIFSFCVGVALLIFGLYGRVSGGLPEQNPYWRTRHGLPPLREEELEEDETVARDLREVEAQRRRGPEESGSGRRW
jgi:hypothetical protein